MQLRYIVRSQKGDVLMQEKVLQMLVNTNENTISENWTMTLEYRVPKYEWIDVPTVIDNL